MKKISLLTLMIWMISGCSSVVLQPGAERIIASPNKPPKGCKYLGQVIGNQGNFFTGGFTSNRNLEAGAMNDIKNQAHKLGANYIQIVTSRAGITGSMGGNTFGSHDSYISGSSQQTNVTDLGNAYHCPAHAIGLE